MLYVTPRGAFSIVSLVCLPGQATSIHDHVSWCVIGVHQGSEREFAYRLEQRPEGSVLVPVGECTNHPGEVSALAPPGDIHRVENPGPGTAISIHVYGADIRRLGSSIRRRYDLPVVAADAGPLVRPAA